MWARGVRGEGRLVFTHSSPSCEKVSLITREGHVVSVVYWFEAELMRSIPCFKGVKFSALYHELLCMVNLKNGWILNWPLLPQEMVYLRRS